MHNGNVFESGAESLHGLCGESDFGQQNDGGFLPSECFLYGSDVKFCFSAVGDTKQEGDTKGSGFYLLIKMLQGFFLVFVEGDSFCFNGEVFWNARQGFEHGFTEYFNELFLD